MRLLPRFLFKPDTNVAKVTSKQPARTQRWQSEGDSDGKQGYCSAVHGGAGNNSGVMESTSTMGRIPAPANSSSQAAAAGTAETSSAAALQHCSTLLTALRLHINEAA